MEKKLVLITTLVFLFTSCAGWFMTVKRDKSISVPEKVNQIHNSFPFIVDLHSDALMRGKNLWTNNNLHVNFAKMRAGNAALQVYSVATKNGIPNMDSNREPKINTVGILFPKMLFKNVMQKAYYQINKLHKAQKKDAQFHLIKNSDDLKKLVELRTQDKNHIGGLLAIEGIHCIGDSIKQLDYLYEKGVRIIGLAHFFDNSFAGSQSGVEKYGLTNKGIELIKRMDSLGMIVDLAHSSLSTIDSVLKYAKKPPIISHVGCQSILQSNRNLSDEYLSKVLNAGGLVGIMFYNPINKNKINLDLIVKQIIHLKKINNNKVDGIAIGSDFDGMVRVPINIAELNKLTYQLLQSGLTSNEVALILGGNSLRYLLREL